MLTRTEKGVTYTYDADGQRVKKVEDGRTTVYLGNSYEKNLSTTAVTTYYYAGGQRVAQRQADVVAYFVGDNLGSTSLTTDKDGVEIGRQTYYPFGVPRVQTGTLKTDFRFTGQRSEEDSFGSLYDYGARFYSPYLNRWIQPDSIVPQPGDPQSLNRYSYSRNNPLRYRDPSGHDWEDVVYNVNEFTGGFLAEWAYVNSAQMAKSLAVQPGESVAATAGRVAGDAFSIYQGAEFMAGGAALVGSGLAFCATGALCLGGAFAVAGGAAVAADGAVVVGYAAANGGTNLSNLVVKASASGNSPAQRKLIFSDKINKQMPKRGWSRVDVENLVAHPAATRQNPAIVNQANGNPVTYYYKPDGYYVAIDDITGEVVQISDTTRPWIDPMTNDYVAPMSK